MSTVVMIADADIEQKITTPISVKRKTLQRENYDIVLSPHFQLATKEGGTLSPSFTKQLN